MNLELQNRLRDLLAGTPGIAEKRMVGGAGFSLHGNLLCGVMEQDLLVRIAKQDYDRFIEEDGARPMVMAGKSGKSYILVPRSALTANPVLKKWVDRALDFVGTLPVKSG